MITCQECREQLYPDDPRVRAGRYNLSGCDYCDKLEYYRRLESQPAPAQVVVHRHINYNSDVSKKQWGRIDAISGELKYLREKLNQLSERKKPRGKY